MKCTYCLEEIIWGGDHSYEEAYIEGEGEGIVSNYGCLNDDCNVEAIIVYSKV